MFNGFYLYTILALCLGLYASRGFTQIYQEQDGYFAFTAPANLKCESVQGGFNCLTQMPGAMAEFSIQIASVKKKATPALVLLERLQDYKSQPHFRVFDGGEPKLYQGNERLLAHAIVKEELAHTPSAFVAFTYDVLGNVGYNMSPQTAGPLAFYMQAALIRHKVVMLTLTCGGNNCAPFQGTWHSVLNSLQLASVEKGTIRPLPIKKRPGNHTQNTLQEWVNSLLR